jgi:hypothetical protein
LMQEAGLPTGTPRVVDTARYRCGDPVVAATLKAIWL